MNKYSYITLLSDDSYIYGVILLSESLKGVKSKYSLEVMVTPNVSKTILNILDQLKLKYTIIDTIGREDFNKQFAEVNSPFIKVW